MKRGSKIIFIHQISLHSIFIYQFIILNNWLDSDYSGNYTVCAKYRNNCRDKWSSVCDLTVAGKYIWVWTVCLCPPSCQTAGRPWSLVYHMEHSTSVNISVFKTGNISVWMRSWFRIVFAEENCKNGWNDDDVDTSAALCLCNCRHHALHST